MYYFKFLLAVLIISTSYYIGYLKSIKYDERIKELSNFISALVMIKSRIKFKRRTN